MCGIAGFIDSELRQEERIPIIKEMLGATNHRGPDFQAYYEKGSVILGHNRLSIIDLSDSANQPMHYRDLTLIYNGEVYNYKELKKELIDLGYDFKTNSDSEVILAAYHKWNDRCVNRFVGMWSFAIWDDKEKSLFCSRDRFGIKPFYYIQEGPHIYFASETKALKKCRFFDSKPNTDQIYRGLQLGWISYKDQSYFECVRQLPAASNMLLKDSKLSISRYWNISHQTQKVPDEVGAIESFRSMFLDSIRLHMRSDVRVGGCLSGGIDSSAIASCVASLYPDQEFHTFTIFYEGEGEVDERPYAREIPLKYRSVHPFYAQPEAGDILGEFEKFMYHQEVPVAGSSPISQYFVMKMASEHRAKVLLDGQGADEFLAGYMHAYYKLIGAHLRQGRIDRSVRLFFQHIADQHLGIKKATGILAKAFLSAYLDEYKFSTLEYRRAHTFLPEQTGIPFEFKDDHQDRFTSFLNASVHTTSLPALLHYEDRNSMAFSIESRVPFLDHRLVEFASSLPYKMKLRGSNTKFILREAMKGIIPDKIYNRRDKKGFVTPGETKWLRGPLKELYMDIDTREFDMLNIKKVKRVMDSYEKGDNRNAKLIWRLMTLNYWLRQN